MRRTVNATIQNSARRLFPMSAERRAQKRELLPFWQALLEKRELLPFFQMSVKESGDGGTKVGP